MLIFGRSNCFGWLKALLEPINGYTRPLRSPLFAHPEEIFAGRTPAAMQTDEQRDEVLARAVDLTVRLAKAHRIGNGRVQALSVTLSTRSIHLRASCGGLRDSVRHRSEPWKNVGWNCRAQLREGCGNTMRSLQHRYGV